MSRSTSPLVEPTSVGPNASEIVMLNARSSVGAICRRSTSHSALVAVLALSRAGGGKLGTATTSSGSGAITFGIMLATFL